MDPFQTRLSFSEMLARLNASQASVLKCVLFAIKYANPDETGEGVDMTEILFDAILEEMRLESSDGAYINKRMNIFCLLNGIVQYQSEYTILYVKLIEFHINEILALVLPDNVPLAVQLNTATVLKIVLDWGFVSTEVRNSICNQYEAAVQMLNTDNKKIMSKEEVQRRIEHDRERHKIAKEEIWTTLTAEVDPKEAEFNSLWDAVGAFDQHDAKVAYSEKYYIM